MSSRKQKTVKKPDLQAESQSNFKTQPTSLSGESQHPSSSSSFPFAPYTSLVGIHTSLLAFTALFLPLTTLYFPDALFSHLDGFTAQREDKSIPGMITFNPVLTLVWICAGTVLLQAWWGGWVRQWSLNLKIPDNGSDSAGERMWERKALDVDKFMALNSAFLATLTTSLPVFGILIIFGAPLTSHFLQTSLLALLLSFLIVFSPLYTLGLPVSISLPKPLASLFSGNGSKNSGNVFVTRMTWVRLFAEFSARTPIERALVYPAIGTVLGCWLGAIPMALDWDRAWQKWPLPPTYLSLMGYILGSLAAMLVSAVTYFADMNRMAERLKAEREVGDGRKKRSKK